MSLNRIQAELFDLSIEETIDITADRRALRELYGLHGLQHSLLKLRKIIHSGKFELYVI